MKKGKNKAVQVKTGKNLVKAANGAWIGDVREIDIEQIQGMLLSEYLRMDKRILNAQQKTFWDNAVLKPGVAVGAEREIKELFKRGYSDEDFVWNNAATKIEPKTELVTNMEKNGEFPQGTLTILKRIEVDLNLIGTGATSYKHLAFPLDATSAAVANYDPSLVFHALKNSIMLSLYRGANKQLIVTGKLEEFPLSCAASGAGSNSFFIQNGPGVMNDEKLMFPEVFEGGEDFWIELKTLNEGLILPVPVAIEVKLKTTQVFTVYR
jgi:hypothetical protein